MTDRITNPSDETIAELERLRLAHLQEYADAGMGCMAQGCSLHEAQLNTLNFMWAAYKGNGDRKLVPVFALPLFDAIMKGKEAKTNG